MKIFKINNFVKLKNDQINFLRNEVSSRYLVGNDKGERGNFITNFVRYLEM